jgi:signal transduction histidine kinase
MNTRTSSDFGDLSDEVRQCFQRLEEISPDEEVHQLLRQCFGRFSHEIRTPLSLVLGFSQKLLQDANLTQEQRQEMEKLSQAGQEILSVVNALFDGMTRKNA